MVGMEVTAHFVRDLAMQFDANYKAHVARLDSAAEGIFGLDFVSLGLTLSPALTGAMPPHTRRIACSSLSFFFFSFLGLNCTWSLDADSCLQSNCNPITIQLQSNATHG